MQALHALALSNVHLCIPEGSPSSFVLRLAPYLKLAPTDKNLKPEEQRLAAREEAERLVCLLPLLSTLLTHFQGSLASIALDMEKDLLCILGRNPFTVVRDSACPGI